MLKKLLLFIVLVVTGCLNAQTFYWVGGSGYWNDINHWSHISGGAPCNAIPSSNANVVFDNSSSVSNFTIHALHSVNFKSITSENTNFNIDVIGSPNVDLTITGDVNLNEYFNFKLNGKINLNPQSAVKYQFAHNKFNNDIYLRAASTVELGFLSTSKALFLEGNFTLKNSIVLANDLSITNSNIELVFNTIQVLNTVDIVNSQFSNTSLYKSNLICQKNNIPTSVLNSLLGVSHLSVSKISPQSCIVTLTGSTNPTCSGLCNGTATFNLSGCTNSPYQIQWLNTDMSAPCQILPPAVDFSDNYTSSTYSVGSLCGCGTVYSVLFENFLGEQFVVAVPIFNPPPTFLSFSSTQPNCNGVCSGQIRATVISGVAPLTIAWATSTATVTHNNVITKDTLKNACAGTYTVTATNNNGCINTFTTTLNQPPLLVANGTSSSITCNAACNGSAAVVPSGGTSPYTTFSWTSASSTPSTSSTNTIGNLCPGVVTMTVTDSKTCTAIFTTTITQPPAITLTITKTDLNCGNVCNGTASVTATGGIGPFTYSWSPSGGTASQATGLCAGNYTCTVTNNGNCIKTITVSILSPPTLISTPTQTNLACSNICIGAININPSGGTGAYTYSWVPAPPTTSVITNLCAGAYNYTVTDALGCKTFSTITITQPPATSLTVVSTNVTCFGNCDGTATATMLGGTGGYTYTWTPGTAPLVGQGTSNVTSLCPATYTVRSADANNCARTQTFIITQPTAITANVTTVSPTCNGVCNGSITSAPSGGTGPYSYTLQSSGAPVTSGPSANAAFTNLCAGSYTLLIRDALNCVRTQSINLTQPNPITLALPFTPINCFNACNSTISTVVGGGTGPYTFTWSAGGTGNSLSNQCAGVHSATVTDSKGCQASATITITSLPDLTVSIVPTNPNCNSQCTGIATTSVSGGTPNYTINWSNSASGNIINNLCQGVYTATVTDFFGCIKTQTVSITSPPALTLTPTNGTVSCSGSCDGTVSVVATGGTSGYFYSWSPTAPTQTNSIANNLCSGNYIVSVTDINGCISSTVAAVAQPTVLTASIGNVQPSCNVCIGAATANGIGGTPPYTYTWSGGQSGPSPNNLCVGVQTVIVTDSKGCTTTQTVQINQTVITVITTNGNTLTCNSACSGVATANPSGGQPLYQYTWTPSVGAVQTSQTATGLCAGTHTVMVSDALGCSSTNTITFTNPPAITLTVNQTNVSCNGACNGVATATAIGGTGVKSYLWQPGGQTTPTINGLCAGAYTVTATDANNCSQTQVVTIIENSLLTATFTPNSPSTCTSANGTITAVVAGGLPTYTLTWNGGSNANPLTNIPAGSYTLTVLDAAGCTQTISTTLSNPTGPTVTAVSNSITCFGACTGSATLTISGTGSFNVNGSAITGSTTVLSGLCSGITTPIVTDANSCVTNQTISIVEPTQLVANGVVTNDPCNASCTASINLTPTGGTLPYSYVWSPTGVGEDPTNLCAGTYTVNITDGNGCVTTNTYVVTEPPALTLTFNKKDVLCNGQCTGGVRAVVGGGASPYSYTWTPSPPFAGANIDTLVNICSGIYTVSVSDVNGCVITGTIDIGQPIALTSTITSINQKCFGQCNGSAIITANGGVAPYSYNYNTTPITPTQTIGGLCIGTYTGAVSDANGCVSSNSFVISQPLQIVVTTTVTNPTCNAICNGSVATSVTGGNPAYHYNWITSGGPVPNPTGLCAGNYTVVVTDDSLCTGQALVVLTDPAILLANTSFTNPSCFGSCNGIVTANPIGGTSPFNYSWSAPTFTSQTVPNLCAGIYTLTLNDVNGCQAIQTVTLTNPPAITINPSLAPATCGISNGSINAIASNGVAPYTYNWLDPLIIGLGQATNTMVTNIPAGTYTVVVTDFSGCSTTSVIALSNSNGPSGATITSTNVTCNGQSNGAADVSNPVGGTPSYTLSWISPPSASSLVTNLGAGTYTAQIEDANNCLFFQSVVITEPQTIDDNEIITSAACLGNCNGSIALNPAGGNAGAYTYSWSPMTAATGTVTNLCPGAYTATITDVMGCTLVANYILPSLTTITSSTFATNNTCFGNCNGSILATNIAGGSNPYTFVWTDGQSNATATNLCNGTYSVIITDANGCFNVFPATVTSPSAVTFTPTVTQPNCGLCDGSAIVNPVGGTAGYTFVWTNGQVINTASNLCAGVYGIEITDANACVTNSNVIVNSSSTFTGETITQQNVSCSGVCDGSVTVTAIGGTGAITYHWLNPVSNSQSLVGLCAGTYFCNMTDANGCTRTASVVIGATTNFTITPQITQSSCSANTGSINVNVVGGTGSYNYTWIPAAANTPSLTNLAPGNYTVTVSDGNCSQTQVYSINSVNGPIVTATQNDVSCSGFCDGSISLIINGGTPAYTTLWSNGSPSLINNGLCVGAYSYTVTDGAGCKAVQSFSLTTGTPIVFSTPDIDNPLCNNNCNGVVTTIPSGGALPYTYSWIVSTSTTSIANALCAGNYSVLVTDADGCSSQETYTLTGPPTISVTAVVTNANCNGAATGSINLTVTGGVPGPGYTYSWSTTAITEDITNLVAGTYSVTITDANGCNVDTSFVVAEPPAVIDNSVITSAACFGNCNGSIGLAPTGGTSPYTYSWTPSANTPTITSLCPGPQTATITDAQGCAFVFNYNVPSLTTITATTLAINNLCFNDCNGILTATNIAGGVSPYTIQWNDPLGQMGNTASGLCTGNYTATITDVNGCFNPIPANISSTSQVTFTPTITQPSCDLCNGSAIVNPVGGTTPYNYLWSNNQVVNTATNLCSGVYAVQITDGNGCVNTTNVVVNSSTGITGETIVSTNVTCDASVCDGSANVTAVGGVAPISYNWVHDNSTSQSITGLCAGTYFCNMTDANGCSRTASVVIGAVTTLTISSQVTQSSCSSSTGSITVNVTGGTTAYTYAWLPAGSTPTLTNLAPGSYTLTVSDGNCSKTQIFTIQSINAPVITSTKKDISCSGVCDGNIAITITGGTPTYTTAWSNGATTPSISALCAGAYSVEVTDAAGCKAIRNFSLSTVAPIAFSVPDLDSPQCHDACDGSLTAIPIGGTMPYTFTWTPNNVNTATTNNLCTGNYSITVADANGCSVSDNYSLINPPTLTLTATITDASCNTALDGAITTTVTGGISPFTYSWTPGAAITSSLTNVLSGTYTLIVTDNFGCTIDSVLTINSTLSVNAIAGNDTLFCQNGTLLLDGSNSNSTFGSNTYEWFVVPTAAAFSNSISTTVSPSVGTSTYVLVATNGVCIDSDTIVVNSNALPIVDAGPTISIPLFGSGTIGGNPTCATGSSFSWSPVLALDNPVGTNPVSGTTVTTLYTVSVIDVNGCLNSDTVTVYVYPEIKIPNGFSPNGDGKNDVWQIDFIDQFPDCEVEVYNRWGEQLFYSRGYAVPFNGQYKGKNLPVGTYYYVVKLNHPNYPTPYTSPLTIFR